MFNFCRISEACSIQSTSIFLWKPHCHRWLRGIFLWEPRRLGLSIVRHIWKSSERQRLFSDRFCFFSRLFAVETKWMLHLKLHAHGGLCTCLCVSVFIHQGWLVWGRASRHQKLDPTFPWIDNCFMATKRDFVEMEVSLWLTERSQKGTVAKGWLFTLCCWGAADHTPG